MKLRYFAGGIYIVDLTGSETIGVAVLLFLLFVGFLAYRRKKSEKQIDNSNYSVMMDSIPKIEKNVKDDGEKDEEIILKIENIKKINQSDGLTCILEVTVTGPEDYDIYLKIEDAVDPLEWEPDNESEDYSIGNDRIKVIFTFPPLYFGRKLIIKANVSEDFDDSLVEEKYTTEKEK